MNVPSVASSSAIAHNPVILAEGRIRQHEAQNDGSRSLGGWRGLQLKLSASLKHPLQRFRQSWGVGNAMQGTPQCFRVQASGSSGTISDITNVRAIHGKAKARLTLYSIRHSTYY